MTIQAHLLQSHTEIKTPKSDGAFFAGLTRADIAPAIESMTENGEEFSVSVQTIKINSVSVPLHIVHNVRRA